MTSSTPNDRAAWLKGPEGNCSNPPLNPPRAWRLILLGAPGVGKGTQAELIAKRTGACHLSTGDVFRAAQGLHECERTPAMLQAFDFMRQGLLVPDETVLDIVRERVRCLKCRGGFLLDGFPRTVPQAEALQGILEDVKRPLDAVLSYELPLDTIVARLSGRRTCPKCKALYHVSVRPPKVEGVCDKCGGEVVQREDDRPESVRVRMDAYASATAPLTDYYQREGILLRVSAEGSPEEIFARTTEVLGALTSA